MFGEGTSRSLARRLGCKSPAKGWLTKCRAKTELNSAHQPATAGCGVELTGLNAKCQSPSITHSPQAGRPGTPVA